jgi:hypothetical protein
MYLKTREFDRWDGRTPKTPRGGREEQQKHCTNKNCIETHSDGGMNYCSIGTKPQKITRSSHSFKQTQDRIKRTDLAAALQNPAPQEPAGDRNIESGDHI